VIKKIFLNIMHWNFIIFYIYK